PETHHHVEPDERFACDLAFLGNRLPDREARVEEYFLRAAARAEGATFLLGGNGWETRPLPQNVRYVGRVYTHEHNALNSTARAGAGRAGPRRPLRRARRAVVRRAPRREQPSVRPDRAVRVARRPRAVRRRRPRS